MGPPGTRPPYKAPDLGPLARVLTWVAIIAVFAAITETAAAIYFTSWQLAAGAALTLIGSTFMALSGGSMRRGDERRGALMLALGLLSGAAVYTILIPGGATSLGLLPVIITAVVLPFVRGVALKRILVGSWFAGFSLVTINIFWQPVTQLPSWATIGIRAVGFAAVLALTLSLLAHHHHRLERTTLKAQADAQALRAAHDKLQETDRAKTQFLNSAAHELRTPLTPVLIQLELIRRNESLATDDHLKHSVQLIERNVMRLKSHVDELLDIARLHSGRFPLRLEDVALGPILQDVKESYIDITRGKKISLHVQDGHGVHIKADAHRITQVLFNLLSNAVKATPPGGHILVSAQEKGHECIVSVTDNGIGIRRQDLPRLFEPFGQITESQGGAGLGLYISRSIVAAHQGTMEVHSEGPGQGATFSFTIPLAGPAHGAGPGVVAAEDTASTRYDDRTRSAESRDASQDDPGAGSERPGDGEGDHETPAAQTP